MQAVALARDWKHGKLLLQATSRGASQAQTARAGQRKRQRRVTAAEAGGTGERAGGAHGPRFHRRNARWKKGSHVAWWWGRVAGVGWAGLLGTAVSLRRADQDDAQCESTDESDVEGLPGDNDKWSGLHYYSRFADSCCQDRTWVSQHAPIMIEEALRLSVETTGQQASAANEKENHPQDDAWALALRALPVELFGRVGTWAIESLLAAKAATPSEERRRRTECHVSAHADRQRVRPPQRGEGERDVELSWVEAKRTKGLALVCQAPEDKIALVVVRGTVNFKNALLALKMWPRHSEEDLGVRLHSGFVEVADELFTDLEKVLAGKDTEIHLTGHSMGGAVCIILGMRLLAKGYKVAQVVAFGAPMVVWNPESERFRNEWASRLPLTRVEHPLDPVVQFPLPFQGALSAVSKRMSLAMYQPVGRLVTVGMRGKEGGEGKGTGQEKRHSLLERVNPLEREKAHRLYNYREHLSTMVSVVC